MTHDDTPRKPVREPDAALVPDQSPDIVVSSPATDRTEPTTPPLVRPDWHATRIHVNAILRPERRS